MDCICVLKEKKLQDVLHSAFSLINAHIAPVDGEFDILGKNKDKNEYFSTVYINSISLSLLCHLCKVSKQHTFLHLFYYWNLYEHQVTWQIFRTN